MRASDLFKAMAAAFDAKPIPRRRKKPPPDDDELLLELSPQKALAERLKEQIRVRREQERELARAHQVRERFRGMER